MSISSSGSSHNPFVEDTWTREFCCLPYTFAGTIPSYVMYPILIGAGLYKKKIGFSSSDKHDDAVKRITDVYPRLATCDGFALHKSRDGGIKRPLQKINTRWYDVIQLWKKCNSEKLVIYIKPLQENLSLNVVADKEVSLF